MYFLQAHNPDFLSAHGIITALYFDDIHASPMLHAAYNTVIAGCPTLSVCNTIRKRYDAIARMDQLMRRSLVR